MSYGETLTEKTPAPKGRTSHKDAKNQMNGYLEWCLNNFSMDEIMAKICSINRRQLRNKHFSELGERWVYLRQLQEAIISTKNTVEQEIERTEKYLDESELEELRQTDEEGKIRNPESNKARWFK